MQRNVSLILVGLVAAALAAVVVWQHGEIQKTRAAVAQAAQQTKAAEVRVAEAEASVRSERNAEAAALQHARELEAQVAATPVATEPAHAGPATGTRRAGTNETSPFAGIAKMMKNPGMKAMIRAQSQGQLDMMYGALFKGLSLSPSDQETFKKLLLDKQMALIDLSMGVMDGSATPEQRKQLASKIAEATKTYDEEIRTLLGEDGFALYQEYEATQPERMQVNLFKQSLSGTDALTEQQEHDLIRALYDERKNHPEIAKQYDRSSPPDLSAFTESMVTNQLAVMAQMHERNLTRAQAILSESQLAAFKKNQDQVRAMQEMGMKMASEMFGAGKSEKQ